MGKITQMYSAFGWHLKDNLMKKYKLRNARDRKRPCLFFGCYGVQIKRALSWAENAKVLIWWSGSDILWLKKQPELIEVVKSNPNISHLATVNFIERDLQQMGMAYRKVPLFSQFIDDFKPSGAGDSIYVYKPGSNVYCPMHIYSRITEKFKSVPIIEAHSHRQFTQQELKVVYAKSLVAVRLVKHDGLAHTAAEIGLMGKKIIWNGDTPNAVRWNGYDDVLVQIERVLDEKYDHNKLAKEVYDYMNTGDEWLYV